MEKVKIGDRLVGDGEPCFIIAEAGVNHNGDIDLARRLISVAKKAGADAVKFQTFSAEKLVIKGAEKARYQKKTTAAEESQYEMIKKLELSGDDFKELNSYARQKGIIFLSSPFDRGSVDFLDKLGVPAFKVPSGEITNFPLLQRIAQKQKPVILSTGMAVVKEIKEALAALNKEGAGDIILLHCVSSYPARIEDTNLKVIATLKRTFKLPVGLSDHSSGITVPIAAVAFGACVIEKHFTLDRTLPGPDHSASLEPDELEEMVKAIREVEKALGDGVKKLTRDELANKKIVRRSLVARVDIPKGAVITEKMLDIKRPGAGLDPKCLSLVIGRKAKQKISRDELVAFEKLI